jgi:preprotein translocase subunit YajC
MTFNFLQAAQAQAPAAQNAQAAPAAQQAATTTTAQTPGAESQQPEQPQGSMMPMIIMLVAMFVIMYFFMIRPQKKRQKQIQEMRSRLGIGDEVILASGIRGKIKDTNPDKSYMTIEVSKGVCIDVDRNYVFTDLDQSMQR